MQSENSDRNDWLTAAVSRWLVIGLLPLAVMLVGWIGYTVDQSAQQISVLTGSMESLKQQIDLKFELRDQRLLSIDERITTLSARIGPYDRPALH